MNQETRFWGIQGFIAGIVLSLSVAILAAGLGQTIDLKSNWATLVAGLIQTLATLATVIALYSQIKQTDRHKLDRERSDNLAARAAANSPLSNLCSYAENCITELRSLVLPSGNEVLEQQHFNLPRYPAEDLAYLIECIRTADAEHVDSLSAVVSKLQISHARMRSLREYLSEPEDRRRSSVTKHTVNGSILDAIFITAWLNELFPYIRREREVRAVSPDRASVTNAALSLLFEDEDRYGEIVREIERVFPIP